MQLSSINSDQGVDVGCLHFASNVIDGFRSILYPERSEELPKADCSHSGSAVLQLSNVNAQALCDSQA